MKIAGFVLGILAVVFAFIPGINLLGPIIGVVGIVLSAIQMSKEKAQGKVEGMTNAALVLSIIGTVLSSIIYIIILVFFAAATSAISQL